MEDSFCCRPGFKDCLSGSIEVQLDLPSRQTHPGSCDSVDLSLRLGRL